MPTDDRGPTVDHDAVGAPVGLVAAVLAVPRRLRAVLDALESPPPSGP